MLAGAAGGYADRLREAAPPGQALTEHGGFGRLPAVPFHGIHQAGIVHKPQRQSLVVSFNVTADGRGELTELLRTVTDLGPVRPRAAPRPPRASAPRRTPGCSGPTAVPDGLIVTAGACASPFYDRYGLAARKPAGLTEMTPFPNDDLVPAERRR